MERFYVLNQNKEIKEEFKKMVNTIQGHIFVLFKLYWHINPYFTF